MDNASWSPYSFRVPANPNYTSSQIPPAVLCVPGYALLNVGDPSQIPPSALCVPGYAFFSVNNTFQVPPPALHNRGHANFFNGDGPSQIPAGYHPFPSSHHNHAYHPHDPFHAAETNDQSLNNSDQTDPDFIQAQEEYEYADYEYDYEDDESDQYHDDESEHSGGYITTTLEGEERLIAANFVREQARWLNFLSTHGRLQENILNFRDAHRAEFYSPDAGWPGFYSTRGSGLSEDAVGERLKTRSVDPTADEDHETLCVVCQDCLFQKEEKISTLDCGHEYHQGCIKNWLMRKNSCPLCNATGIRVNLEEDRHVQS